MRSRFGGTAAPEVASRVVYACVMAPEAGVDPGRLVRLGETALPWVKGNARVLGAALYRAGRFDEAIRQFDEAHKEFRPFAWDWLYLAMAHHGLGHADAARRCLDKAEGWIADAERQAQAGQADVWTGGWCERLVEVPRLRREAEALLDAASATPGEADVRTARGG
jgi:tetratricopeptide (TPR) repeat protein